MQEEMKGRAPATGDNFLDVGVPAVQRRRQLMYRSVCKQPAATTIIVVIVSPIRCASTYLSRRDGPRITGPTAVRPLNPDAD